MGNRLKALLLILWKKIAQKATKARRMQLSGRVLLHGFVLSEQLGWLYWNCCAMGLSEKRPRLGVLMSTERTVGQITFTVYLQQSLVSRSHFLNHLLIQRSVKVW